MSKRRKWTGVELALLTELYSDMPTSEIAKRLGRSSPAVSSQAGLLGLKKSREYLARTRDKKLMKAGKKTRFDKGFKPWNAGKKGWQAGGRSVETQFKPGRKPEEARNYRPIGSLRVTRDGYLERKFTDDPNLYPTRRWIAEHRRIWEEANGPVPKGHVVVFKPGCATADPDEITLDKIDCITRAENMRRNSRHNRYPPEINQVIQLRGVLTRKINQREKR